MKEQTRTGRRKAGLEITPCHLPRTLRAMLDKRLTPMHMKSKRLTTQEGKYNFDPVAVNKQCNFVEEEETQTQSPASPDLRLPREVSADHKHPKEAPLDKIKKSKLF